MLFLSHLIPLSYAVSFHLLFIWSCLILINLVSSSLFSSFACHLCPVSSYLVLSHLSPSYLWLVVLSHLVIYYLPCLLFLSPLISLTCRCHISSPSHLSKFSLHLVLSNLIFLSCAVLFHLISSRLILSSHFSSSCISSIFLPSPLLLLTCFVSLFICIISICHIFSRLVSFLSSLLLWLYWLSSQSIFSGAGGLSRFKWDEDMQYWYMQKL